MHVAWGYSVLDGKYLTGSEMYSPVHQRMLQVEGKTMALDLKAMAMIYHKNCLNTTFNLLSLEVPDQRQQFTTV